MAAAGARRGLRRGAPLVLVGGLALAAARPWLWPLALGVPPLGLLRDGALRAELLFVLGGLLAATSIYGLAWLHALRAAHPLSAAQLLDRVLGTPGLVASAHELPASEARSGPSYTLLRRRACAALASSPRLPVLPTLQPTRGFALAALGVALLAAGVGALDPAFVRLFLDPPTRAELEAAAELRASAAELGAMEAAVERSFELPSERSSDRSSERSRRAADVASDGIESLSAPRVPREPGEGAPGMAEDLATRAAALERALALADRERARRELAALRALAERRRARLGRADAARRRLGRALREAGRAAGASDAPGRSAADELRLLARRLRAPEDAGGTLARSDRERVLERLARAAEEARRTGAAGEALAQRLEAASASLTSGARVEAAEALERAAARSDALGEERERRERGIEALARLLERAGRTERAMQLARLGVDGEAAFGEWAEGGAGSEEGGGVAPGELSHPGSLSESLATRLAAMELAARLGGGQSGASGRPGRGLEPPGSDAPCHGTSCPRAVDAAHRDEQTRSEIGEGARAVATLEGLGTAGDARTEYRALFPGYGAVAEESLGEDRVPAARRPVVRRYFESIRPGRLAEWNESAASEPEEQE